MEKNDKKLALWEEAIPRMNEEDLEFILDFSDCFEPQMVKMVKDRYKKMAMHPEEEDDIQEAEENTITAVLQALDELGCHPKFDIDDDIQFTYQDENFYVTASDEDPFIEIWEYNWMKVSLNDIKKVSLYRQAINDINYTGEISTTYSVNKESHELGIHCGTKILFYSFIPNRQGYLEYVLKRFFDAHRLLEEQFLKLYNETELPDNIAN